MVATVAYRRACAGRVCRGKGGRKHRASAGVPAAPLSHPRPRSPGKNESGRGPDAGRTIELTVGFELCSSAAPKAKPAPAAAAAAEEEPAKN
eukprot:gene14793-biopygen12661